MEEKLEKIIEMDDRLEALFSLCRYFEQCDDGERAKIREMWDFGVEWDYPDQFRLAQKLDGQRPPEERIRASLVCDSIDQSPGDPRDKLFGFALIYNSAQAAGMNPDSLFQDVAAISSEGIAKMLKVFAERINELKSPEAFCLKKIEESCGVRFELE